MGGPGHLNLIEMEFGVPILSLLSNFSLSMLNSLSASIALVDTQGTIIAVNQTWRYFAEQNNATSNVSEGVNYLQTCLNSRGHDAEMGRRFGERLQAVLQGEIDEFSLEYPCHAPWERRWFMAKVSSFLDGETRYAVVTHENISERVQAEQLLIETTSEQARREERQRLSRELHDGISQTLFSIMTIAQTIPRLLDTNSTKAREQLENMVQLSTGALSEMRMLLLELRPDTIEKTALAKLISQLLISATSLQGITADFSHSGVTPNLPPDVHFAIYRITQEAINNVIKHSQASQLKVRLDCEAGRLLLLVEDNGVGFDMNTRTNGIGYSSMHERAAGIQAQLAIDSAPGTGTRVHVEWVPPTGTLV